LGVFASALSFAVGQRQSAPHALASQRVGLAAWLFSRFRRRTFQQPRLAFVEKIVLAPRQIVALIEADGQRVLVATSAEGAPAFFPLAPKPNRTSRARKTTAAKGKSL
jgi:flagellar biogenesis protein FliO